MRHILFATIMALISSVSSSAQFDALSKLDGATILEVGRVENLDCPIGGDYDCLSWPTGLARYRGSIDICFVEYGRYLSYDRAALAINESDQVFFLVKGMSIGREELEFVEPDERYRCPDVF